MTENGAQTTQRGEITRDLILRAAERLFAEQGVENVSVRSIIAEAGQKNESALQYHFGSRHGLVQALLRQRELEVNSGRRAFLEQIASRGSDVAVRDLCECMLRPAFQLCKTDSGFRNFICVFSQPVLASTGSAVALFEGQEASIMREVQALLRKCLPELDAKMLRIRFEDVLVFATQCMSMRARSKGSFKGKKADFFYHNLIDTMAAMFSAPVSDETASFR